LEKAELEKAEEDWIEKYRAAIREPEISRWQRTKQLSKRAAIGFVTAVVTMIVRIRQFRFEAHKAASIPKKQERKSEHTDAA
jgi:hypothetical protein